MPILRGNAIPTKLVQKEHLKGRANYRTKQRQIYHVVHAWQNH